MRFTERYIDKGNRDARARDLRATGTRDVRKRSARNVTLSPDYIRDAPLDSGTPNGFGGMSPSYYPAIYIVEYS